MSRGSAEERFLAKVAKNEAGCWVWTAYRDPNGYGRFTPDPAHAGTPAHRWAYEHFIGPLGSLYVDHLCLNRSCVNPAHLDAVTNAVNVLRGNGAPARHARKTHCVNGHEFTAENTQVTAAGHRRCRACGRKSEQERRRRG